VTKSDITIDPRGYRFGAAVTLVGALTAVLLDGKPGAIALLVLVALFLPGAIIGPQATLQAWLFRTLIRPRISAPREVESFRPARFAQQVGLTLSAAGAGLGLAGVSWAVLVFGGFVLAASFLNAVFGYCLGCEMYLGFKRLTARKA
jgi:hypothetical protein